MLNKIPLFIWKSKKGPAEINIKYIFYMFQSHGLPSGMTAKSIINECKIPTEDIMINAGIDWMNQFYPGEYDKWIKHEL